MRWIKGVIVWEEEVLEGPSGGDEEEVRGRRGVGQRSCWYSILLHRLARGTHGNVGAQMSVDELRNDGRHFSRGAVDCPNVINGFWSDHSRSFEKFQTVTIPLSSPTAR